MILFPFSLLSFQIILVDDGSKDSTFEVAKAYVDKHPKVFRTISLKKNQGKGGAVKVAVNNARGKYILMVSSWKSSSFLMIINFVS